MFLQLKSGEPPKLLAFNNDTNSSTKYIISNYYTLTVKNLTVDDAADYECRMQPQDYTATLFVSGIKKSSHDKAQKVKKKILNACHVIF